MAQDLDKSGGPVPWDKVFQGPTIGWVWDYGSQEGTAIVDLTDFGGVGDNATDNAQAVAAAYAALKAGGGGTLYIPQGTYRFSSWPVHNSHSKQLRIIGAGGTATTLVFTGNGNFITCTNTVNDFEIGFLHITSVIKTNGYDITLEGGRAYLHDVTMDGGYNGVLVTSANTTYIERVRVSFILGPYQLRGDATAIIMGQEIVTDNPPSFGVTQLKTWAQSTPFVVGDLIRQNGICWQCSQSGTSSNAGTGPAGIPGNVGSFDNAFGIQVNDGTAGWIFVSDANLAGFTWANGAQTCTLVNCEFLNGAYGFRSTDNNSNFVFLYDVECENATVAGFSLEGGTQYQLSCCWASSFLNNANALQTTATFQGDLSCGQGHFGGASAGVGSCVALLGGTNLLIVGNQMNGGHAGVFLAANVSHVTVANNVIVNNFNNIFLNNGTTDFLSIVGNDLSGNTGGQNLAPATLSGTHNIIRDNRGYNPVGASTVTTGASPWTYTAGSSPETLYLSASTSITALTCNGNSILTAATAANAMVTVELGPNEIAVVTYTGTLTAKKMIH